MQIETIGKATLYLGDCREMLAQITADAVVTDPPYGINGSQGTINKARAKGDYVSSFVDDGDYIRQVCVEVIKGCIQRIPCVVLTPGNRHFCMYPQPDSFGAFYQPAAVGLQTFGNLDAQPIFYYGKNGSGKNMGKTCSFVLTESPEKNGHPCVKPIKVWTKLVHAVTRPGQVVFDPFMGSGTTGVSCMTIGLDFVGCELEREYFDIACERIERAQQQLKLAL